MHYCGVRSADVDERELNGAHDRSDLASLKRNKTKSQLAAGMSPTRSFLVQESQFKTLLFTKDWIFFMHRAGMNLIIIHKTQYASHKLEIGSESQHTRACRCLLP